ncbi:unnamed protein product [Moneuplotes crassus]|uniref:Uncharacterized protein n=1 Tax=Euplotes crassus TaxID=5936 RepID=A0AAD1UAA8_EUPCR|nr:unnamed protein product [Moneuplotes crassus]
MAEIEPPLTLISEHLTKHHQESWGWFDNYATCLQKVKEYQKTNVGCNQALVAQKSFNNLREMYRIQKETEGLNKNLMIFQDHYARLSANSQFSVEKYTFEFELAKHSGRMLADATSNNLNLQLWIQDCVGSIQLTPIKKKADKDTSCSNEESKEETIEQSDICLENKDPPTELDNSESTINQPELSTKTMNKESEITLNLSEKYLLFQEEKLDLFGNHKKLLTVHKFLSVIKPSTPLSLPLDSCLDSSTNTFKIKFLVYDYSPALQEHLKDSLTSVAGMLKEALERTQQVVDKLDDQ